MSFIPKNPLTIPEVSNSPLVPETGTRGLFAKEDGWYDIDSDGVTRKLGSNGAKNLRDGIGENSLEGADNNENISVALGDGSVTFGESNVAGCKGYYIKWIDYDNKTITLTTNADERYNNTENSDTFTLPYAVGDKFSIINGNHYDLCGTISAINNNIITYSEKTLGFTSCNGDLSEVDEYTLRVPLKPNNGEIQITHYATAFGRQNNAAGQYSFSEGRQNNSYGNYSHTEGKKTKAAYAAHAEGNETEANGQSSHSEGYQAKSNGFASHTEGNFTEAKGQASHAEGGSTQAIGSASHAEGSGTEARGDNSHTEGLGTLAVKKGAHAEGGETQAWGDYSHAEGYNTYTSGWYSHAEGECTYAESEAAHSEGYSTHANGYASHSEGASTIANAQASHAEGSGTKANGDNSHSEGLQTKSNGESSHAEGRMTLTGRQCFKFATKEEHSATKFYLTGNITPEIVNEFNAVVGTGLEFSLQLSEFFNYAGIAIGLNEKDGSLIIKEGSAITYPGNPDVPGSNVHNDSYLYFPEHPELGTDVAPIISVGAHAEGYKTAAVGEASHAEGEKTKALGDYTHSEGHKTLAKGESSHAEGRNTEAKGENSHAEGLSTKAEGKHAHSEGYYTEATGEAAHAEGWRTKANGKDQHVQGRYNIRDDANKYAHILGNGTDKKRSNAHTVDWDGLGWFAGGLKIGGTSQDDPNAKDVATVDVLMAEISRLESIIDELVQRLDALAG